MNFGKIEEFKVNDVIVSKEDVDKGNVSGIPINDISKHWIVKENYLELMTEEDENPKSMKFDDRLYIKLYRIIDFNDN